MAHRAKKKGQGIIEIKSWGMIGGENRVFSAPAQFQFIKSKEPVKRIYEKNFCNFT
jgi:hypothetical protein